MAEKLLNKNKTLRREVFEYSSIFTFWCRGCGRYHHFDSKIQGFNFNGNLNNPTFEQTLHDASTGCRLTLKNGMIEYQSDSPHKLAGQRIPLEPLPDEIYRG